MEMTAFFSRLLPDSTSLRLDAWQFDDATLRIILHVTSTQTAVPCPVCTVRAQRVHRRYTRLLADLPWGPARVQWQLRVRTFICTNTQCSRRLFTERLTGIVAPWARRTQRMAAWLIALGLALGGAAGVRLSRCLGMTGSRHTLQQKTAQRRARRVECHQQVWALRAQGWPCQAIAAHLGIGKRTVFRYLRTLTLPERTRRCDRGRSLLNPYKPYLLERWNAGCRDALRLYGEIQQYGYPGSSATVARYAQRLCQAQGQAPRQRPPRQTLPTVAEPHHQRLTARRAIWLVLRREEKRDEEEARQLAQWRAQHPEVAEAIDCGQDFARLVRQRQPDHLDPWLARVAQSTITALHRFAERLADDDDAVKAGVTRPWRSGPVEGQITRLKMLKRQMFGRASLALLQRRFVLTPGREPGQGQRPLELSEVQARPAAA